ncbi:hypothetical protein [Peterkaempfera sp. SMS 1(5)a]|uniref:hypothetical protein n=1 Tax=Peterkaempfera podocarpi TaxID=3232308 RepID=UPI00366F18B2
MADLSWLRLGYNGTALAAGVAALPLYRPVLAVAGDEYGVALALMVAAALVDRRWHCWPTRALLATTLAGLALTWPVLGPTLTWLTGAHS